MRAQSSIEFLTVYGFLFIILGLVLSALIIITYIPHSVISSSCSFYNGQQCTYYSLYSNSTAGYSLLFLIFPNPQATPINISSANTLIANVSGGGSCTPQILYPGEYALCVVQSTHTYALNSSVNGFFSINARLCNSGLSAIASGNCTGDTVSYGGSFSIASSNKLIVPYVAVAGVGPKNVQFPGFPSLPILPFNFTTFQYGTFSTSDGSYAYGTPSYQNNVYLGLKTLPFPNSLSVLNNNNVACSKPYNSTFSIFYTMFYTPSGGTYQIKAATDDSLLVYYKPASASTWSKALSASCCMSTYTGNVIASAGLNDVAIAWTNVCTPGAEAINATLP